MSADDNKEKNKKIIGGFCLIVIIIFLVAFLTGGNSDTTEKEAVTIKELDFDRFGYAFDNALYGTIDAVTGDGTNHTYYVTKEQMASLYYGSNKTFKYPDGILLSYHKVDNGAGGTLVVDHLYYSNGTEIPGVSGEDADVFAANSVDIGKSCDLCNSEFGLTSSET